MIGWMSMVMNQSVYVVRALVRTFTARTLSVHSEQNDVPANFSWLLFDVLTAYNPIVWKT